MINLFLMSMSILSLWAIKASNPVKISMSILFVSVNMFTFMFLTSGQSWFPAIMLMLFMGGIIMMFMILSSILPNEKTLKIKNPMVLILGMVILTILKEESQVTEKLGMETKSFLSSGLNFWFMTSIILIYFVGSMSMISMEETPMRSVTCCKSNLIL